MPERLLKMMWLCHKGKPRTSHCHGGRPCKNEAEHITPGGSPSNSTNGEGNDEAELLLLEAHQAAAQIENIVNSCCSSRHCGCCDERKNAAVFVLEGNHAKMKQNVLLLLGCLN